MSNNDLSKSEFDTTVVIDATECTTFETAYEFDSDGYLNCGGGMYRLYGSNSDGTSKFITTELNVVFVKKGMKISFIETPTWVGFFRLI